MASVAKPPQPIAVGPRDDHVMDTRTPSPMHSIKSPGQANGGSSATSDADYHPELSQEVAMLSTKLINAINLQTTLDDQLQQTRHELEMSQRQFEKLQAEKKYLDDMIHDGILVKKSQTDPVIASLKAELLAEKSARETAEKSKKQTESELENLTSALFEEANEMVSVARKETEAADKRNSQLRSQLSDTKVLLASQQEQLQDLKLTMEKMSERGDNGDSMPTTPTHPPSAGLFDGLLMSPNFSASTELPPEHPLHFTQLLVPVLRNDVTAYNDFQDLLSSGRRAAGHLRASSSGSAQNGSVSTFAQLAPSLSGSQPNLPGAFSFSTTTSPQNSVSYSAPAAPLKDTKFYKRSLLEDIEPTLRLDLAPGLSFLSRRSVLSAFLQGCLVVEPFAAGAAKFYGPVFSCALCGENRKDEHVARRHRFKTSDEDNAQRYPLCDYCLGRIRAAGDFITFLRMVRDGHWRGDTEEEQKSAWEESVRLRERMFWARIGGGVVPTAAQRHTATPSVVAMKSARPSLEDGQDRDRKDVASPTSDTESKSPTQPKRISLEEKLVEVFQRHRKSMSIGKSLPDFSNGMLSPRSPNFDKTETADSPLTPTQTSEKKSPTVMIRPIEESNEDELVMKNKDDSVLRNGSTSAESSKSSAEREENAQVASLTGEQIPMSPESALAAEMPPTPTLAQALPASAPASAPEAEATRAARSPSPKKEGKIAAPSLETRKSALNEQRKRTSDEKTTRLSPERKTASGVLARVRAMEAHAQPKP